MSKKRGKSGISFFEAVTTLIGTIIGAGILGIPYVIAKAGILIGLLDILILGIIILVLNLYMGEICLRTKKVHQFSGLAEKYLGKFGKIVMTISFSIGTLGALIAYIIGEGQVLSTIFGLTPFAFSLIFFFLGSILIFMDLQAIRKTEAVLVFIKLIFISFIIVALFFSFKASSFNQSFSISNVFVPYGVILFALSGAAAIPEMEMELKRNKKQLKKAIMIGSIVPIVIYALFSIALISVLGINTPEVATLGLKSVGGYLFAIGNVFAFLSMFTSFLILGLSFKWMLHYDFNLKRNLSAVITCLIPLAFFLAGARNFISTISLVGAISGGINGILIALMVRNAKKKSEIKPAYSIPINWFVIILFIVIFALGILYQFI